MPYAPELTTLAYVVSSDRSKVLLVHRTARDTDEQLGKYNGLGGKVERDEDIVAAVKREILEGRTRNNGVKQSNRCRVQNTGYNDAQ